MVIIQELTKIERVRYFFSSKNPFLYKNIINVNEDMVIDNNDDWILWG